MTMDMHIKFDGIDGESAHKDHKGEIEVLSWSWGVSRPAGPIAGGGSGRSKPVPGELLIVHHYDKASPMLAKKIASGAHIKTAVLTARKAGEGQKDFLLVTMTEVSVNSVQTTASEGGEITEQVALSYARIDFSYAPSKSNGTLETPVTFGWDLKTAQVY